MATRTVLSKRLLTAKEAGLDIPWDRANPIRTVLLDDAAFVSGTCRIVIECDWGDGRGFVFEMSANGIEAGAKSKFGTAPGIILPFGILPEREPKAVRISVEPEKGSTPVVGVVVS